MILIRGGFIFNALYAACKPFVNERTRSKFIFANEDQYFDILLSKIDRDQIPRDYGGYGMMLNDTEL